MSDKINFDEIKEARTLPSPTGVALNVMRMCRSDNVSLPDLSTQIQADPVLAGRLIQLANASRRPRTRPVVAVSTEVLLLIGVQAVRQVALSVSLINSYQNGACHSFDYNQFWSRSLAMACVAQAIGERQPIAPAAELFTCGLLAGIGRLGLAAVRPDAYGDLLEKNSSATVGELMALERDRFGYDRVQLSAAMMDDWKIPSLFVDAVRFYKKPMLSGWEESNRRQRLARLLNLAAFIADIDVATEDEKQASMPSLFEKSEALGLNIEEVTQAMKDASKEWIGWREAQRFSQRSPQSLSS
ncbi:hypothetical protein hmeg3_11555 [Herbaspirillum sp. meg3]|uniref:HDOD domain-containing protein n=1 Tax=Herbaspirillum sp. meg3 TaxID=2025949 RepID=UPI000B99252E|nr:HDOD domain-containing protein [Herbaspirillum sp. meg3]ASU38860.1 hypothetical protein hmeg3_11555 [Herbaspirillum sp. meg3]